MDAIMNPDGTDESRTPIAAPEAEAAAVVQLRDFMAAKPVGERRHASLRSPDGHQIEIPDSIYRVLVAAVAAMAPGNAVSIVPVHHELTRKSAEFGLEY